MAEQTLKNNPSLPTIAWKKYLETADYLIENPKGTKDGWDYKRVEAFLKFFAINSGIKPDFDLEKASLQEVVNFLRLHPDIFSETGEHLESLVPSLLLIKELLADWEEAKTKFEQERAVKKLTERLENISFGQKYQQIIQERLTQSVPPQLAEALAEELPLFPQPSLALKKLEELPEPQKEILMQQMTEEIQETVSVAIINLEKKKETSP